MPAINRLDVTRRRRGTQSPQILKTRNPPTRIPFTGFTHEQFSKATNTSGVEIGIPASPRKPPFYFTQYASRERCSLYQKKTCKKKVRKIFHISRDGKESIKDGIGLAARNSLRYASMSMALRQPPRHQPPSSRRPPIPSVSVSPRRLIASGTDALPSQIASL